MFATGCCTHAGISVVLYGLNAVKITKISSLQEIAIQNRRLLKSRDMRYAPDWLCIMQPCHVTSYMRTYANSLRLVNIVFPPSSPFVIWWGSLRNLLWHLGICFLASCL